MKAYRFAVKLSNGTLEFEDEFEFEDDVSNDELDVFLKDWIAYNATIGRYAEV